MLEGAGAVLFVLDIALGAKMLLLFVLVVTPIMHPFWTHAAVRPRNPQPREPLTSIP